MVCGGIAVSLGSGSAQIAFAPEDSTIAIDVPVVQIARRRYHRRPREINTQVAHNVNAEHAEHAERRWLSDWLWELL